MSNNKGKKGWLQKDVLIENQVGANYWTTITTLRQLSTESNQSGQRDAKEAVLGKKATERSKIDWRIPVRGFK